MAFKNASRVHETCSNNPNAATAFNLSGAVISGRTFVAGIGTTNTCIYCAQAVDGTGANEAAWEIGVGTVTSGAPDTLTRTQIMESSNANAAVDFSTSTAVEIFTVDPAANLDAGGSYANGLAAGIYHYPIIPDDFNTTTVPSWMGMWYLPILVDRPIIINAVTYKVVAASASHNTRVGMYKSEDGIPTDLLQEYGTVSTATAGIKEITGLSHFLPPGKYYIALQAELNIATYLGFGGARQVGMWMGYGMRMNDANNYHEGAISESNAIANSFGTGMPNPAGSVATLTRDPNGSAIVAYKFSEV